ncbi:alpha/beta fold hydrolase [Streptomyces sp. ADMS]|uniref:alpha/beta fold hydrolase n=1 Tax=Streptomyces sp. ADMS TaxID=3071415 RepID=UPI00296E5226|nr:alpha/beta fold hydrolase [Streptomyces sp. ADMS]MDW4909964.1 alpha/beta fold hydrolase [Streptomyces sp. ADMS]
MTWTRGETETVRTDDGTGLWARRSGQGEPLALCHGGPGLWDMFEDVTGLLGDVASVVRWDQRGCGRSDPSDGPWTTERAVADLDAVRGHFGLERMTLLGHSWGAQLALSYALAHPERVRALVYVSGTGIGPDAGWHDAYRRNFRARLAESPELLARWSELTARRPQLSEAEARERAVLQWSAEFPERERALEHARRMADPWLGVNFACNRAFNAERNRTWARVVRLRDSNPAEKSACSVTRPRGRGEVRTCSPAGVTVRVGWPSDGSSATTAVGDPGGAFTSQDAAGPVCAAVAVSVGRAVTAVASRGRAKGPRDRREVPFSHSVIR